MPTTLDPSSPRMPKYPPVPAAIFLTAAGAAVLLLSLFMQFQMWQAVFGLRPVAPGGGEYMTALFFGMPSLLLSVVLLGIATARAAWRSKASAILLVLALAMLSGWLALFVRSLFV